MKAKQISGEAVRSSAQRHPAWRGDGARLGAAVAALVAIAPSAAHAYLDPGHAYVVLQGAIGMFAALGATLVLYRDKVRAWLGRPSHESTEAEPSKHEQDENNDEFER